jgi:transcriptional regulator of acetoin/glycerol metabolism
VQALQSYDWPGNVRELRAVLESAATMASEGIVCEDQIHAQLRERLLRLAGRQEAVRAHETLSDLLSEHDGDVMAVATALGVNRATVYRRLRELGIPTPRQRRSSDAGCSVAPTAARIRANDQGQADRFWS